MADARLTDEPTVGGHRASHAGSPDGRDLQLGAAPATSPRPTAPADPTPPTSTAGQATSLGPAAPASPAPARGPGGALRQLLMFGVIGALSTALTIGLYALLRTWWPPLAANLVALVLTSLLNTEANRRFTFADPPSAAGSLGAAEARGPAEPGSRGAGARGSAGARGRRPARGASGRVHLQAFVLFCLYYAITSGALLLLGAVVRQPPRPLELTVLVAASAVGTIGRFLVLRAWVFRPNR